MPGVPGPSVTTTTYDAAFHPLAVTPSNLLTPSVTYGYDALGRLALRSDSTTKVEMFFHAGGADQVAQEDDSLAGVATGATTYLLDSAGSALGQTNPAPGGTTYRIADPRGDVVQVTDGGAGVVDTYGFDPFGNAKGMQTSSALLQPGSKLRFQGSPRDDVIGQYTLGPRLYNPQIDRFVGADLSAGSSAGLATQMDPLTGNRYLYAGANPAGLIDDGYGPSPVGPDGGRWYAPTVDRSNYALAYYRSRHPRLPAPLPTAASVNNTVVLACPTCGPPAWTDFILPALPIVAVACALSEPCTNAVVNLGQKLTQDTPTPPERDLPDLTIEDSQFGQKIGQHARDFGLDPADAEARDLLRGYIENIRSNYDEVRQGPWNPKGGGGPDFFFFRKGADVVVTQGDGTFVSILKGGESNGWFHTANPR